MKIRKRDHQSKGHKEALLNFNKILQCKIIYYPFA